MKLKSITEVQSFNEAIDKCKGNVYLMDAAGNQFNLKSMFSRYISIGQLLKDEAENLELFCDKQEDEAHFMKLFAENPSILR